MGPPLPCNNVKLVDIPDMEYWASRGQGEVCVMGANVFQGYFRSVTIGIGVAATTLEKLVSMTGGQIWELGRTECALK